MTASGERTAQLVESGPALDTLGLAHRVFIPPGSGPHPVLVMVHGLSGTEDAPWIFARSAGPEWLIISPRAPFPLEGGYTWNSSTDYTDPESYRKGLAAFTHFVEGLAGVYPADRARLVLLGFSQGAALAYAFAMSRPVNGIAALAGFIPRPFYERVSALRGVPILMLHGTRDERIPIEQARADRDRLAAAGADLTYAEDNVTHKVSVGGLQTLKQWLAARLK
jgi:phospholipase/carboxylesterase